MARSRLVIFVGIVAFAAITCQLVGFFTPGWMRMYISTYDRDFLLSGAVEGPFSDRLVDGDMVIEETDEYEFWETDNDQDGGDSRHGDEHPPPHGHGGHSGPHGGGGGGGGPHGGHGGGHGPPHGGGHHGSHGGHGGESSQEEGDRKKRQADSSSSSSSEEDWWGDESENQPLLEPIAQDPTKVEMYITIGLWYTRNCSRHSKSEEHHRHRHHHHHCCNTSFMDNFLDDVANRNMMDTVFTALRDQNKKTGNTKRFFTELRVTATIGVVLGTLGFLSVICTFRCEKCKCSKYAAIFLMLLSGMFTLLPVARISVQSHWVKAGLQWSQAVQGSLCFPYSVLVSGIGGVLSILTVFGLIIWMCVRNRRNEYQHSGLAFDNDMYVPTGDKKKVPGFLFAYPDDVAEPLQEKVPIVDAVEPEK